MDEFYSLLDDITISLNLVIKDSNIDNTKL